MTSNSFIDSEKRSDIQRFTPNKDTGVDDAVVDDGVLVIMVENFDEDGSKASRQQTKPPAGVCHTCDC